MANNAAKPGFFAVLKTVLWSFLGIRSKEDHARDTANIKPIHLIIAGIIGGIVFVLTLVIVVKLVLSGG